MASKWLRGIVLDSFTSNWTSHWHKIYALWLEKVLGFTYVSESVGGGRSWRSTEKNGANGVFSGTNFEFVDATAASFALSDVGKYIVINDDAHYINAGVYRIAQYVTASKIVIDYAAGFDEYPIASTGLSWWIFAFNYQIPTDTDYIILESKNGWQMKLISYTLYYKLAIQLAPSANWAKQISAGTTGGDSAGLGMSWSTPRAIVGVWGEGDCDTHDWVHMWFNVHQNNLPQGLIHLASIENLTSVEADLSDDELIMLKASTTVPNLSATYGCRHYSSVGTCYTWSDKYNSVLTGYYLDYTYNGWANNVLPACPTPYGREINVRRDSKKEIYRGSYVAVDENNTSGKYQILGIANGHWSVPVIPSCGNLGGCTYSVLTVRHNMLPLTKDSPGDLLYLNEDIAVPWCNLSIRAGGI